MSDGTAEVGYRVAQRVSGHGVATSGVRMLCRIAREDFGLSALTAATSNENLPSQRVLIKVGFAYVGPTEVAGRGGMLFGIELVALSQEGAWPAPFDAAQGGGAAERQQAAVSCHSPTTGVPGIGAGIGAL
jgi:hypothetical protein